MSATEASFTSWLGRQGDETEPDSRVVVRNAGLCAEISDNERDSCVFTLKVFLLQWGAGHDVEDAIRTSKWKLQRYAMWWLVNTHICVLYSLT